MEINNFIPYGTDEFNNTLKSGITMVKKPEILPYRDALMSVIKVNPQKLNPTSFYYLRETLEFQRVLREKLLELGYDTLNLNGMLEYIGDDGKMYTIVPPVVEVTTLTTTNISGILVPETNIRIPVLLDGIHRALLATEEGEQLNILHVDNVDPNYPAYAYPNNWDEVKPCDEVPKTYTEKKRYVKPEDPSSLYKKLPGTGGFRIAT